MKKIFYLQILIVISFLFIQCEQKESDLGNNKIHEYVDLGLSVKWATCNVGATKPEEYGDYFAWGEVESKKVYSWETYKYGNDSQELTKYCSRSDLGKNGFTDTRIILEPKDDAAKANWGGNWRMPTEEEIEELIDKCTWNWTQQNGTNGYKVVGPNANSIFLPAAGYTAENSTGMYGSYWSSSLSTEYPFHSWVFYFNTDEVGLIESSRKCGSSVRPVYQNK